MSKNLLIVESPAKAKTIEKFLGADFTVLSSYGHVRDLEKTDLGIDIQNNFKPRYVVTPEKLKVVKQLKDQTKMVSEVWLATDEDREGEAISWHLCEVLGLDVRKTKRIVFHEITKPAIQKAIANPRLVDVNLVDAQQARRVLDRLVGYELSEVLWKKVKGKLSAGRVQSVAVKLVVERERDITNFNISPFYKIAALFNVDNGQGRVVELKAEAPQKYEQEGDANAFLQKCVGANYKIEKIEKKPIKRKPAAPFTTSTLQQEASRKLGFSVNRTMSTAQKLYEAGHITYMRTDSTNLSDTALASIAQAIEKNYGQQYVHVRKYKTKNENAQEAHEAIRPTYIENVMVSQQRDEQKLYELIWKRAIASQMADAELEKTIVDISISTAPEHKLVAEGEVLKFDGFLKVYLESKDEDDEDTKGVLPPLKEGQLLDFKEMTATERFTRPPSRFTEASLVKQLEELGIGRPSTYAPTITKIMEEGRGYVVKETREGVERIFNILTLDNQGKITKKQGKENTGASKNQLFPTDMGMLVSDFLDEHFKKVMNYGFTAEVEAEFDNIAEGKGKWADMIGKFYGPFHQLVEDTIQTADRATKERILGVDPESGRTVLARMAKFGPLVQIGATEELNPDEKPRYANLKATQSLETITLEEALKLFGLPKNLGEYQDSDVIVGAGRFGPYVKIKEIFISLDKGEDPLGVTMERALQLYQAKQAADAPIAEYEGLPVTKGTGRFGPFIKWNGLFINVPRKYNFENITAKECEELILVKIEKEDNRFIKVFEAEKVQIENGRWGPFIRFQKKMLTLPRVEGQKMTNEQAALLTWEEVKKIVEEQVPGAFEKKASAKKATTKAAPKKAAPKKK